MSDFWNSKTLKPPVVNSFKCKSAIDINNVISILNNGIETFIIPDALQLESSVMRRMIYRLKLQFRLDKGFKLFENTNRCLNNLLAFNITEDLIYFLDEVPKKYDKDLYFPSKQMLQYVLIRLQGYSQVSSRVVDSAFQAAIFMKGRMKLGQFWQIAVVSYAVCSRIWQICKQLTIKCCLLFNELLPLLDKLEIAGTKWLPDNYEFPTDLIDWLNYDWLLDKPDIILQLPLELPIFSLLDDDEEDVQFNGRYQINKSNAIIINDSDDDDFRGNELFQFNFNNIEKATTTQRVPKDNSSITITITDDRKKCTENSSCLDYSFSQKRVPRNTVTRNNKISSDSLNLNGVIPLDSDDEVIQIDDSIVEQNDVGETVSRKDFLKIISDAKMLSDEEIISSDEGQTVSRKQFDQENAKNSIIKDKIDSGSVSSDWEVESSEEESISSDNHSSEDEEAEADYRKFVLENRKYFNETIVHNKILSDGEIESSDEGETVSRKECAQENAKNLKDKKVSSDRKTEKENSARKMVQENSSKQKGKIVSGMVSNKTIKFSDELDAVSRKVSKIQFSDKKDTVTTKAFIHENTKKSKDKVDSDAKMDIEDIYEFSDVDGEILEYKPRKQSVSENETKNTEQEINVKQSTKTQPKHNYFKNEIINIPSTSKEKYVQIPASPVKKKQKRKNFDKIVLKGFPFKIVSAKDLQDFLDREDRLRRSPVLYFLGKPPKNKIDKRNKTCISSHLDDAKWNRFYMNIKYYIAKATNSFVSKTKHMDKAKQMLNNKLKLRNKEIAKGVNLKAMRKVINCLHTPNQLVQFYKKISEFRKKKNIGKIGLFNHLNREEWGKVKTMIKTCVNDARTITKTSSDFIREAKELLVKELDVKLEDEDVENPNIKLIKRKLLKSDLKWSDEGKRYFISSLNSLFDLQLFLDKEERIREISPNKCIYRKLAIDEWEILSNKIKNLIDLGQKQPIQRFGFIKEAKKLLMDPKLAILNSDDSNVNVNKYEKDSSYYSDDNSDIEELQNRYRRKYDTIYHYVTEPVPAHASNDLFDYVRAKIEPYEVPTLNKKVRRTIRNMNLQGKRKVKITKIHLKNNVLQETNQKKSVSNRKKRKLQALNEHENYKRMRYMYYHYYYHLH